MEFGNGVSDSESEVFQQHEGYIDCQYDYEAGNYVPGKQFGLTGGASNSRPTRTSFTVFALHLWVHSKTPLIFLLTTAGPDEHYAADQEKLHNQIVAEAYLTYSTFPNRRTSVISLLIEL